MAVDPSTRKDTLQAPRKAKAVPFLVVALVLLMVASMVLLGMLGGWLVAFLVPVMVFGLALAVNVIIRLVKGPPVVVVTDEEK